MHAPCKGMQRMKFLDRGHRAMQMLALEVEGAERDRDPACWSHGLGRISVPFVNRDTWGS